MSCLKLSSHKLAFSGEKWTPAEDSSYRNPTHMNNTLDAVISPLTAKGDYADSLYSDI